MAPYLKIGSFFNTFHCTAEDYGPAATFYFVEKYKENKYFC